LKKIALIGNPNSGKSSVFNLLTGLRQKTGNYPGITVDIKYAKLKLPSNDTALLIDFPGCYNLYPTSHDEKVVAKVMSDNTHKYYPDALVYIADSNALSRHLVLLHQLRDLGIPILLCCNMEDISTSKGLQIDYQGLGKALGIACISLSAREGVKSTLLLDEIEKLLTQPLLEEYPISFQSSVPKDTLTKIKGLLPTKNDFQALLALHHLHFFEKSNLALFNSLNSIIMPSKSQLIQWEAEEILSRCRQVEEILPKYVIEPKVQVGNRTFIADKILTHSFIGPIIFFCILGLIFQGIFSWAEIPMNFIDNHIALLSKYVHDALPNTWYSNLLTEGVLAGLGGVLVFIPQLAILFLTVGFLEEMGYMSRAAYLFDRLMCRFGLNGRSIVSLISGAACAIPAIMSTRTITNWKERLITIMVTPLISCSARLPVFAVLIAFVVPAKRVLGFLTLQGLFLLGLYILGVVAALVSAYVFKLILKSDQPSYLILELPEYKWPSWKNVLMETWIKIISFVKEAGKIIVVISIILWFLASYGPDDNFQFNSDIDKISRSNGDESDHVVAAKKLENSYAGHLGKLIEPVIAPLGFDWKIGIALITSFAAREVFVGTMATIYSIGKQDAPATIRQRMALEVNPQTGKKVFTPATAASLLIFYLFAMQCMSTIAVVRRETGTWKWPIIQLIFMSVLAYLSSWLVFSLMA